MFEFFFLFFLRATSNKNVQLPIGKKLATCSCLQGQMLNKRPFHMAMHARSPQSL